MRIDKFLKTSRIIKRRTIANEACDRGKIIINGRTAKASTEVKEGDTIRIQIGDNPIEIEVISVNEHVLKDDAKKMYKILNETKHI